MKVHVRLFASLREKLPDAERGRAILELAENGSLLDLIKRLGIEDELAQMVLRNGQPAPRAEADRAGVVLEEGDAIAIFPPLAGG